MSVALGRDENSTLGNALASLLVHLRGHPYGRFLGGAEDALHGEADRFVRRLAEHIRYTEEGLFPALREVEPGSARDLAGLEKDHRLLHLYARDLAIQILARDTKGAYEVARSFLAVLLDHLEREMDGVNRIVLVMAIPDARRLFAALHEQYPAPPEAGGFQNCVPN